MSVSVVGLSSGRRRSQSGRRRVCTVDVYRLSKRSKNFRSVEDRSHFTTEFTLNDYIL